MFLINTVLKYVAFIEYGSYFIYKNEGGINQVLHGYNFSLINFLNTFFTVLNFERKQYVFTNLNFI